MTMKKRSPAAGNGRASKMRRTWQTDNVKDNRSHRHSQARHCYPVGCTVMVAGLGQGPVEAVRHGDHTVRIDCPAVGQSITPGTCVRVSDCWRIEPVPTALPRAHLYLVGGAG